MLLQFHSTAVLWVQAMQLDMAVVRNLAEWVVAMAEACHLSCSRCIRLVQDAWLAVLLMGLRAVLLAGCA